MLRTSARSTSMKSYSKTIEKLVRESLSQTGQQLDESLLKMFQEQADNPVRQARALRKILEQAHESLDKRQHANSSNRDFQMFISVSHQLAQAYYKDPN